MIGQFIFSCVLLSCLVVAPGKPDPEIESSSRRLIPCHCISTPLHSISIPSSAGPDDDANRDGHKQFVACILLPIYVAGSGLRLDSGHHGRHLHGHPQYVHGHALHTALDRDP